MNEVNTISVDESRLQLVSVINDVRADAVKLDTAAAVDYAIQGTLAAAATAITVTGVDAPVLEDFAKQIAATWVETVNS